MSGLSVNNPPLIVADHCVRLAFLNLEQQFESAEDELGQVIQQLFDASLDNVLDSNWDRFLEEKWEFEEANEEALRLGYDLRAAPKLPVQEWEYFWFMILAKERNWIARTTDEKAEVRLMNNARGFAEDRETIRVI